MKKKVVAVISILLFVGTISFGMYFTYLKGYKTGYYSGEVSGYYEGNHKGYEKGILNSTEEFENTMNKIGFSQGYKFGKSNKELTLEEAVEIDLGGKYRTYYCVYPKCKIKLTEFESYCGKHNCDYKGCKMPIMYSSTLYCNEHKCIIPECNSCKTGKTSYCKIHK